MAIEFLFTISRPLKYLKDADACTCIYPKYVHALVNNCGIHACIC